ncbi:MAG: hypothetical protein KDK07_26380 [Bauldia sp.]|nr:hypothetical protein [Bauldia sp.]
MARWLLRAAVQGSPVGRVLNALDAALWVRDHYAYIEAYYLDGPKYLEQLQADARKPKRG